MHTAKKAGATAALALTFLLHAAPVSAGPDDYVASPIVEEGEREIELNAGRARLRDGSSLSSETLKFGWGVNAWWRTELAAKWHRAPGEGRGFDAWEWENYFQLTETGRYPIDLGLLLEIERPKDRSEGYEVRWGPLLQAELGSQWLANLNVLWTKHVRAADPGEAELGLQWQLKYRLSASFEPGVQGFSTLGPWQHWAGADEQSHVVGPAVFGRFSLGHKQTFKYEAALLAGVGHGSPRHTLRLKAEYEF